MAENKTQPTEASVDDFIAAATPDRRRDDGQRLAEIFREVTGTDPVMWGPSIIGYGSYRYQSPAKNGASGDWPKTGFSPRKSALSLRLRRATSSRRGSARRRWRRSRRSGCG